MTSLDHPAPVSWTTATDYEDIRYEHSGDGIAKITINRPHVRNAFRPQTLMEISEALVDAREDGSIGAIILTGEGPDAFCSGGDQNVRGDTGYLTEPGRRDSVGRFHVTDLQIQMRRLPKPIVAMVNGRSCRKRHPVFVRLVRNDRNALHTFRTHLLSNHIDAQIALQRLTTSHGNRIIVKDLVRNIGTGSACKTQRQ